MKLLEDRRHYVYIICKPDGTACYVGKGSGNRLNEHKKKSHNPILRRMFNKYGDKMQVSIHKDGMTHKEALSLEIELIAKFGRLNTGSGTLVNLTDGGEGIIGIVRTQKMRDHLSKLLKGKPVPAFIHANHLRKGQPKSPEHAQKLREHLARTQESRSKKIAASLCRPKTAEEIARMPQMQKGVPKSLAHRKALSDSHKGLTLSESHKRAIGDAHLGKKRSPEARARMALAQQKVAQRNRLFRDWEIMLRAS